MRQIAKLLDTLRGIATVFGFSAAATYTRALIANLPAVVRSGNLDAVDHAMIGRSWPVKAQGARFQLDGKYFGGAREMYCRQVYFPTPAFALKPGTTVVDLGSNAGLFSLLAAHAGCRAIAVEAQRGFANDARSLAAAHGLEDRVTVENSLVAPGTGAFGNPVAIAKHATTGLGPAAVSMEQLLEKYGVTEVDFMKVDIEGSEFALMESGAPWLRRVRRLAMEVHSRFGSIPELRRIIEQHGMTVELRDNDLRVVDELPADAEGGYLFAHR